VSYALQFYSVKEITVNRLVSPRPAELLERFAYRCEGYGKTVKMVRMCGDQVQKEIYSFGFSCTMLASTSFFITDYEYKILIKWTLHYSLHPSTCPAHGQAYRHVEKTVEGVDGRLGSLWLSSAVLASASVFLINDVLSLPKEPSLAC